MTAEAYLEQIKKLDAMIENREKDRALWEAIADGSGGFSVSERVQSTQNPHRGQNAIIEYVSIEEEIKKLRRQRQEIIDTIGRLPYYDYQILYKIYVEGRMVKQLPSELKKSLSWVKKRKQRALELLQKVIDGQ